MTDIHEEQKGEKIIKKIFRIVRIAVLTISVVIAVPTGILAAYCYFYERELINFMLTFLVMKDQISQDYIGEMPPDSELYLGAYKGMVSAVGALGQVLTRKKKKKGKGCMFQEKNCLE
ncbi:hypothetical protein FACS1894198_0060 [Clostridia bacterium]|nr:hypothetical protein FACS1894198_0060 [Clostridia bacterium]